MNLHIHGCVDVQAANQLCDLGMAVPATFARRVPGSGLLFFEALELELTGYNRAHFADAAIESLAVGATPPHTARLTDVVSEVAAAMIEVRPDCAEQIAEAVDGQFGSKNPDQLIRAKRLPPLPLETIAALARDASKTVP